MTIQVQHDRSRSANADAFSLVEVLFAFTVLALSIAGIVYGYWQANRLAEWSSMSLAAQSYALQGMDQARAAQWNRWDPTAGGEDQLPAPFTTNQQDYLDIPMKGVPYVAAPTNAGGYTNWTFFATNYILITSVTNFQGGTFPQNSLRQIQSICYWTFPLTGKQFSNTVITLRASDE
jgi:type II secretory pathway pseudopilin PulG